MLFSCYFGLFLAVILQFLAALIGICLLNMRKILRFCRSKKGLVSVKFSFSTTSFSRKEAFSKLLKLCFQRISLLYIIVLSTLIAKIQLFLLRSTYYLKKMKLFYVPARTKQKKMYFCVH